MSGAPWRLNFVSFLLLVVVGGIGYSVWKVYPIYFTAWQIDHELADGGARAYKLSRIPEPSRSELKQKLVDDLRRKVVAYGVADPDMTLSLDFVAGTRVDVACDYLAVILHPVGGLFTILKMHRTASTSLTRTDWDR